LKEKSDIPTNPDCVLTVQSPRSSESPEPVQEKDQFSQFERSQKLSKMVAKQRELQELRTVNDSIAYVAAHRAFQHDHGSYCKSSFGASYEVSEVSVSLGQCSSYDEAMREPTIPAEVGK